MTQLEYGEIKRLMRELQQKATDFRAEAAKHISENNREKAIECMDQAIRCMERVSQMMNDLMQGDSSQASTAANA